MRVIFSVPNDTAYEQLQEHDSVDTWYDEENQLVAYNVVTGGTTVGGGIQLHTRKEDRDIIYPEVGERGQVHTDELDIRIDHVRLESPFED